MTGAQGAIVAGIAVVALGAGYGIASMGGEDSPPPAKKAAAARLPAVTPAPTAKVRIAVLGTAPALPAPKRTSSGRAAKTPTPGPSSNPTPAPTSAPTAAPTSAPTSAPTANPTPARTPDTGTIG